MTSTTHDDLMARAGVYRYFSKAFLGQALRIKDPKAVTLALSEMLKDAQWPPPEYSAHSLAEAHRTLFGHNLTPDCPPYETQFHETHIFQQAQTLADIAGFYRAFGLDVAESAHERADHLSVELEFMGYLCLKEWHALASGREGDANVCRDAQKKFLGDHVGVWAGAFAERLAGRAAGTPYAGVARALGTFVHVERERLGVVPSSSAVYHGAPEPNEKEGCGTCVFTEDES